MFVLIILGTCNFVVTFVLIILGTCNFVVTFALIILGTCNFVVTLAQMMSANNDSCKACGYVCANNPTEHAAVFVL